MMCKSLLRHRRVGRGGRGAGASGGVDVAHVDPVLGRGHGEA